MNTALKASTWWLKSLRLWKNNCIAALPKRVRSVRTLFERYGTVPFWGYAVFFLCDDVEALRILSDSLRYCLNFLSCWNIDHPYRCKVNILLHIAMTAGFIAAKRTRQVTDCLRIWPIDYLADVGKHKAELQSVSFAQLEFLGKLRFAWLPSLLWHSKDIHFYEIITRRTILYKNITDFQMTCSSNVVLF